MGPVHGSAQGAPPGHLKNYWLQKVGVRAFISLRVLGLGRPRLNLKTRKFFRGVTVLENCCLSAARLRDRKRRGASAGSAGIGGGGIATGGLD